VAEPRDRGWTVHEVPPQEGRRFFITGANTGLGFQAARALARQGAHVVLACRDTARGQSALDAIRGEAPDARVALVALDLASLESIRRCADAVRASCDRLDVLLNNAGVMALPQTTTADGFERQIGTNHLGHFALTGRLLPTLLATLGSRVVTVSSLMHKRGRVDADDLFFERRGYDSWAAYSQSKLANLLFTYELDRRLRRSGQTTNALAAHPGYAATELQARGPAMRGSAVGLAVMRVANAVFAQSSEAGAAPELRAATDPAARGGEYYGPGGPGEIWGRAVRVQPAPSARDEAVAVRLWEASERLTGVTFGI